MEAMHTMLSLIASSFLTKGQKDELTEHHAQHGEDDTFFEKFNAFLIAETDKRIADFEAYINGYDAKCTELEATYTAKMDMLEEELEATLKDLGRDKLKERDIAFNEYYEKLNLLNEQKRKELMVLNAEQVYPLVQAAYA